ncbi:IS21-like element helper ATPase IstB [Bdellovibrionota bacterium FG-2]
MELETIRMQRSQLRLPTAARELEEVLSKQKKAVSLAWVSALLEREIDARRESSLKSKLKAAKFPVLKTWETFDFDFNPHLDLDGLSELKTLAFVRQNQIIQFLGPPGTGKSHLATALGILATNQGHRVYWTSAKKLQKQIIEARLRNNLDDLFRKILAAKLWIYDDFGVVTYSREVAEEVFDLLDRRKHSSALILTSNRAVIEWPSVFPDLVLANATIDRMFEQSRSFIFNGHSYRLKGKIHTPEVDEEKLNG